MYIVDRIKCAFKGHAWKDPVQSVDLETAQGKIFLASQECGRCSKIREAFMRSTNPLQGWLGVHDVPRLGCITVKTPKAEPAQG